MVRDALLSLSLGQTEVAGQPLDVEVADGDVGVAAAIPGALSTVVTRHGPILCKVTKLKAY